MALTVNNLPSVSANRYLFQANRSKTGALEKLSSGLKINQAKDGPAGLVISEFLRSQLTGLQQSVRNTQEANNVFSIAEGGLSEMSNQLRSMRQLALHALNSGVTGDSQIAADQAEMNSGVYAIGNITATTKFSDQFLLNGGKEINFSNTDPDNIIDKAGSQIESMADIAGLTVDVEFSGAAADQAEKAVVETSHGATTLGENQEFTITGSQGSATFQFGAEMDLQSVADVINTRSDQTGVTAYAIQDAGGGPTELRLVSEEYGGDETVRVEQTAGNLFATEGQVAEDAGQNAVVTVDGQEVEADGLTVTVQSGNVTGTIELNAGDSSATTVAQAGYDEDTLTEAGDARSAEIGEFTGGMRLQLGEGAGMQNRDIFGLRSMNLADLGRVEIDGENYSLTDLVSGGSASLATDPAAALQVIDQAIADVSAERGRIGAYQANTLQTNANSLNVAIENITATESGIRDADMANQITEMIKARLLEDVGIMGVQSAKMSAGSVLKLLGM